jgi:hypothetical protein
MVWIRRVRTASGATAVQIAESVDGRRRIIRHVGSARDEAELGLLMEQARQLLVDDAQRELDLGITPKAVKAEIECGHLTWPHFGRCSSPILALVGW